MTHPLVLLSYSIKASRYYTNAKNLAYDILDNTASLKKRYFDFFMIFLVLSTIAILIYEVNHPLVPWLDTYELFAIIIFIVEWFGRFWIYSSFHNQIIEDYEKSQILGKNFIISNSLKKAFKEKFDFIVSPLAIIDLLAILPYYRPLRILRILLLFRLFKILRYTNSINQFSVIFREKKFEFLTLLLMFLMVVAFGSTIIFIYEGAGVNANINSFFDAIYWAIITISTVGYGDISPITFEGKLATLFLAMGGLSVIAFNTSIITAALTERMQIIKEEKVVGEANRLKEFVVICGFGHMGKVLASEFEKVKQKFIIIEQDDFMLEDAISKGYLAIRGDATDTSLLDSMGIDSGVTSLIAITDSDAVNLSIVLSAKSINDKLNIIALANNHNSKEKLKIAGANQIVLSNEITALVASEYVGQPIAFEAIDEILIDQEGATMDEIEVLENSHFIGKKLEDIDFDGYNLSLIGIVDAKDRSNFQFNPKKNEYIIQSKDIMIVIGYSKSISEFKVHFLLAKPRFKK